MQTFIAAIAIFTAGTLCLSIRTRAGITEHIISAAGRIAENGCVPSIQLAPSPRLLLQRIKHQRSHAYPETWSNNTTAKEGPAHVNDFNPFGSGLPGSSESSLKPETNQQTKTLVQSPCRDEVIYFHKRK